MMLACASNDGGWGANDPAHGGELTHAVGEFAEVSPGVFTARANAGLDSRLTSSGLQFFGRGDALGLRFAGLGTKDNIEPVPTAEPLPGDCASGDGAGCNRRVEFRYPGVTEWWVGNREGIEQGWTVYQPPAGQGPLLLALEVEGADRLMVDEDGLGATLVGSSSSWRYEGLRAWDADGTTLFATMVPSAAGINLLVDVASASWPVFVDPVLSSVYDQKILASAGDSSDQFGSSVAGPCDVNGDGYGDLVVGAGYADIAVTYGGAFYVFHGGSSGIDSTTEYAVTASDAETSDQYGWTMACAGDVNADGFDDVIASADLKVSSYGAAYVYLGSASGIDAATELKLTASDAASGDLFGGCVAGAGDVNGDGYDDVLVGSEGDDDGGSTTGSAYIYFGSSAGIDASTESKLNPATPVTSASYSYGLAGVGDVNADGYGDVVVGAGIASSYFYLGSAAGVDLASEVVLAHYYGVAGAGDVNSDGYADFIIGERNTDSAYVYYGSATGPDTSSYTTLVASDEVGSELYGSLVAGAGDLDSDGYDDVIVAAKRDDDMGTRSGSAYVYFGSPIGVLIGTEKKLVASDGEAQDLFSSGIAGLGDVDGDGDADIGIGAINDDDSANYAGSAYIFEGSRRPSCRGGRKTWYLDADGDGGGDAATAVGALCPLPGYVRNSADCDDADASVHPGAREVCGDGIDADCDGVDTACDGMPR